MNTLAPIALFVYNRPVHTQRTLDALSNTIEAKESILYIYCDGAKEKASSEQLQNIDRVRHIANNENRFKEIHVIESAFNKGLAKSITTGVTEVVAKYGKIIVLEDDLVVSTSFLKFMNNALDKYNDSDKVACISGYVYPLKNRPNEDSFFIKGADCWGWATWKNKWTVFNPNPTTLKEELTKRKLVKEFDFNNSYPYFEMLVDRGNGKNQSWAILWYASAFLKGMYCLYPSKSLVQNIGNDGSGTHAVQTSTYYDVKLESMTNINFPAKVEESKQGRKAFESFFKSGKTTFVKQTKNYLRKIYHKLKKG